MGESMSETLTVTDNRNGNGYELEFEQGATKSEHLRTIKRGDQYFGLMSYDPWFDNTAPCRSAVTELDGERGILRYSGYPIERLRIGCRNIPGFRRPGAHAGYRRHRFRPIIGRHHSRP